MTEQELMPRDDQSEMIEILLRIEESLKRIEISIANKTDQQKDKKVTLEDINLIF